MATFTTYSAAAAALRNSIASGALGLQEITIDGNTKRWHSPKEQLAVLQFLEQKAASETGAICFKTYARNGGRG